MVHLLPLYHSWWHRPELRKWDTFEMIFLCCLWVMSFSLWASHLATEVQNCLCAHLGGRWCMVWKAPHHFRVSDFKSLAPTLSDQGHTSFFPGRRGASSDAVCVWGSLPAPGQRAHELPASQRHQEQPATVTHTRLQPSLPTHFSLRCIQVSSHAVGQRAHVTQSGFLCSRRGLPGLICPVAHSQRPLGKRLPRAGGVNSPSRQQTASRL